MGFRSSLKNSHNYAYGNGAFAGKLTLLGDERGEIWYQIARGRIRSGGWRSLYRLPISIQRFHYFKSAYHYCIGNYRVEKDVLQPLL